MELATESSEAKIADAPASSIEQYPHSQRRRSSCPELRDGVIMAPRSPPTSPYEWHKTLVIDEDLRFKTQSPPNSVSPPPDEELDITEVQEEQPRSSHTEKKSSIRPHQPNEEQELDLPAPTWNDYPPAPNTHPLRFWHWRFWWHGIRKVLGYEGTPAQKDNYSLFWKVLIDFVQIVVSIVFLVIAAHTPSRTNPTLSERTACHKPIAAWIIVWIVKRSISCARSIWANRRQKLHRYLKAHPPPADDVEAAAADRPAPQTPTNAATLQPRLDLRDLRAVDLQDNNSVNTNPTTGPNDRSAAPQLPHTLLFNRVSLFLALFGVIWWIASQVFLYSSSECRESSPHLWWTLFALVCVQYLALAELVFFAVLVFFLVPIVLLIINSFLLCLGRPPVRAPTRINPEIGKLPKETVARIPLVLYIPHPHQSWAPQSQNAVVHSYPPKAGLSIGSAKAETPPATRPRPRWIPFLSDSSKRQADEWEAQWEAGAYPFVRLTGSRAVCHVCLEEFQEPKRRGTGSKQIDIAEKSEKFGSQELKPDNEDVKADIKARFKQSRRKSHKVVSQDPLQLEDAGNGAQPLRLLECGHVFHRSCIDPWLTDVSGRCPVCQRAVELDRPPPSETDLPNATE